MLSKKNVIIISIALLVVIGFFIAKSVVFRESKVSVGTEKADIEIDAASLVKSFELNETEANAKYLNKIILVEGVVDNIASGTDGITVYLKQPGSSSGVLCSFGKDVLSQNKISTGETLKIKGVCGGYLMDVILNKCSVVKQ